jgi:RES domain-containing protein
VTGPPGWNAHSALAKFKAESWTGKAWRFHRSRYDPLDSTGSLLVSGRYNRGSDQFPADQTWPALYLALSAGAALGEIIRHITPKLLANLNDFRLSELDASLSMVLDCRDPSALGLHADDLFHDYDFEVPHELADAAIHRKAEALLVQSATGLGVNLILFPSQQRTTSRLTLVDSRDVRLYVKR